MSAEAASSAGGRLRAAREASGLSLDDVATKLKLSPRQVSAIEAEDWDALPERTFTRGFFRSYARLVGVDEKVVDNAFVQVTPADLRPLSAGMSEVTAENTAVRASIAKWLIPTGLLALLAAGIAWYVSQDISLPQSASKLPMEAAAKKAAPQTDQLLTPMPNSTGAQKISTDLSTNTSSSSIPLLDGAAKQEAAKTAAAPTIPGTNPDTSSSVVSQANPTSATVLSVATVAQSTLPTAPTAAPNSATAVPVPNAAPTASTGGVLLTGGQRKVTLTASGRSWTEVRSRGDVVLSEMLSNNARELSMSAPISFVIGNASNVKLSIDGKPYDFSMHVRNEVARFRVE
jgi:cytoskeleton protein RodZ